MNIPLSLAAGLIKEQFPEFAHVPVIIRAALEQDTPQTVALSRIKRLDYAKAQPQFWKYAEGAEDVQQKWFEELIIRDDHICLVAECDSDIVGFIIGRLVKAPEVYDSGGLTLMIDDFCVSSSNEWASVGRDLLGELQKLAKEKGASQTLVVCGAHDQNKREFLRGVGLDVASEWYVGGI
jgi:ribosomal protein S18 acetylase RimI-like enzyme